MARLKGFRGVTSPIVIKDDDDSPLAQRRGAERDQTSDLVSDLAEVIDLTTEYVPPTTPEKRPRTERTLESYQCPDGVILMPGMAMQMRHAFGDFQAKYFKIAKIVCLETRTEPVFRGWIYTRTRILNGRLPRVHNEVCLVAEIDLADPMPWEDQALVDLLAEDLHHVRELRTTNAPLPEFRYTTDHNYGSLVQEHGTKGIFFERHAALVCRFRFLRYFNGPEKMRQKKPCQWEIARISEQEADGPYRKSAEEVARNWRGRRRPGGSHVPGGRVARQGTGLLLPGQTYSTGDVFAGAGGVSRGMTLAGAHVVFAVDNWERAVGSLEENFTSTDVHHTDVTDFITKRHVRQVDILHLSPPCQVWSPAHTVPGKNDEVNESALLSCGHLVKKIKPRLFTLEQTFGILHDRFQEFFNALLLGFTDQGYSVRWQVINLATYGLPQPRRRLIIIGAGPGETLPNFPKPTHAKDGLGGLKPFVTARQALYPLEHNYGDGEDHCFNQFNHPKPPWNPDLPLSNTITCDGGRNNYYWDGTREFSVREFALLQGFPETHRFVGTKTDKKRQIGNAFPPSVVKVLYSHLMKWLDKQDGIRNRPPPAPAAVIYLDLDPIDVDQLDLERKDREREGQAIAHLHSHDVLEISSDEEDTGTGNTSGSETIRGSPGPACAVYPAPPGRTTGNGTRPSPSPVYPVSATPLDRTKSTIPSSSPVYPVPATPRARTTAVTTRSSPSPVYTSYPPPLATTTAFATRSSPGPVYAPHPPPQARKATGASRSSPSPVYPVPATPRDTTTASATRYSPSPVYAAHPPPRPATTTAIATRYSPSPVYAAYSPPQAATSTPASYLTPPNSARPIAVKARPSLSPFISRGMTTTGNSPSMNRRQSKLSYRSLQRAREGSGLWNDPVEIDD